MSEKSDVKVPEEIRKGWEEARLCVNLIREGLLEDGNVFTGTSIGSTRQVLSGQNHL